MLQEYFCIRAWLKEKLFRREWRIKEDSENLLKEKGQYTEKRSAHTRQVMEKYSVEQSDYLEYSRLTLLLEEICLEAWALTSEWKW